MLRHPSVLICTLILVASLMCAPVGAANLTFQGTQYSLDNGYFPGGGLPYVTAYWRTSTSNNIYSVGTSFPDQYYGHDGYALFATTFSYPNANLITGEAYLNPDGSDPLYPNLISLPTWVTSSQPLVSRMAGGWAYALVDDPTLVQGIRHWSFYAEGDLASGYTKYYPPAEAGNNTGQNPYVKIGFLDGWDIFGHNPEVTPAGRWGFTVGADVPQSFRIGVMTDGGDQAAFAPVEVFLQQYNGLTPVGTPLGSGTLARDRFVDMHFFDITGASAGDTFIIGAMAGANSWGNAGIAGFSFDVLPTITTNADFDSSGQVDGQDFLTWQTGFGLTGASLAQGDANGDGTVDGDDLTVWNQQYGAAPPIASTLAAVPEPTSLLLLATGALACCSRRRV